MRDVFENKYLELAKIHIDRNILDMMTEVVTKEKHVYYRNGMGMEGAFHAARSTTWSRD